MEHLMRPYVQAAEKQVNSLVLGYAFLSTFVDSVLTSLNGNNLETALINSEKACAVSATIFDTETELRKQIFLFETRLNGFYSHKEDVPQSVIELIKEIDELQTKQLRLIINYSHKLFDAQNILTRPGGAFSYSKDELTQIHENVSTSPMALRYLADPSYAKILDEINANPKPTTML